MSSYYPVRTQPAVGPEAFSRVDPETAPSQAAVLLLIGRQLRGDDDALLARARQVRRGTRVQMSALEADDDFPVPTIPPTRRRFTVQAVRRVTSSYGHRPRRADTWRKAYADCAASLYSHPDHETATALLELSLSHPLALVRIAAAAAYYPVTADRARLRQVLVAGVQSDDELERTVAATALARNDPRNIVLRRLTRARRPRTRRTTSETITIVHGTWATNSDWYQPPNGDFFTFIAALRSDLYSQSDFFRWSGGYSDAARSDGADELVQWVTTHQEQGLDLMGHSHGANVILLATRRGLTCGKAILLSCPVHVAKYFPDFTKVQTPVWSVRVKHDLVILADGGAQKFNDPKITEIVLPIWFDHFATHDPSVWTKYGIAQQVDL